MSIDAPIPNILDDIYDAGASPDRWPALIDRISQAHGARGGVLFYSANDRTTMIVSPPVEGFLHDYASGGWLSPNVRGNRVVEDHPAQFRTDSDYFSPEEMAQMPLYRDFLAPAGFATGAATAIQGASNDVLGLAFEGFAHEAAARAALPSLDRLRPHLARAASLSMRIQTLWSRTAVNTLELAGIGAAVIGPDDRLRAANARFYGSIGDRVADIHGRLRFRALAIGERISLASMRAAGDAPVAASIPLPPSGDHAACVLHLIPLRRTASDVFESDGLLVIVADPVNRALPNAGTLRLLFDLTPAEAAVAVDLANGHSLSEIAARRGVTLATTRTQVKTLLTKTSCKRQAELVSLISGFGTSAIRCDP